MPEGIINPFKSDLDPIEGTMCPWLTAKVTVQTGPTSAAAQLLPIACHRGCAIFDKETDGCSLKLHQPSQPVGLCGARFPMACQLAVGHSGKHCSDADLIKAWGRR